MHVVCYSRLHTAFGVPPERCGIDRVLPGISARGRPSNRANLPAKSVCSGHSRPPRYFRSDLEPLYRSVPTTRCVGEKKPRKGCGSWSASERGQVWALGPTIRLHLLLCHFPSPASLVSPHITLTVTLLCRAALVLNSAIVLKIHPQAIHKTTTESLLKSRTPTSPGLLSLPRPIWAQVVAETT